MRWAKRVRMGFIRELMEQRREFTRADLMQRYGVSLPQASADIKTFMEYNPGAIRYDATKKRFVATGAAKPAGRDTTAAADVLMRADDEWLRTVALRDPSMIRDVAAALIYERNR